jgi:hypothetical protein
MPQQSSKRTTNGHIFRDAREAMLVCQFARFFVVGGYKPQGVCYQRFTVLRATLRHFHDAFGNYLSHGP